VSVSSVSTTAFTVINSFPLSNWVITTVMWAKKNPKMAKLGLDYERKYICCARGTQNILIT